MDFPRAVDGRDDCGLLRLGARATPLGRPCRPGSGRSRRRGRIAAHLHPRTPSGQSRETGALLDAPAIAALLADRVEPGDRILATGSDTILEYYLERRGIDARPLLYTDEPAARTFVVVNTLGGQTLDDLLAELDGRGGLRPPELLQDFDSGRVYLVLRSA